MSNESALVFWRIILWGGAAIVAAALMILANFKINQITEKNTKEKEVKEVFIAEEKHKQLKELGDTQISETKKTQKLVKKMDENKKTGDTYNVVSHNQSGGITAGKVEINVSKEEQLNELDIPLNDNYVVRYSNNRFECHPKVGKWEKPYIAVSFDEKETYVTFGSQTSPSYGIAQGIDGIIGKTRLFGGASGIFSNVESKPATSTYFYYLELNKTPTYIVFGNYEKVLYKYFPSNGTVTLY